MAYATLMDVLDTETSKNNIYTYPVAGNPSMVFFKKPINLYLQKRDQPRKHGLVTILHIAKGFTYFIAYSAYCFTYFTAYFSYCKNNNCIAYSAYCIAYSEY